MSEEPESEVNSEQENEDEQQSDEDNESIVNGDDEEDEIIDQDVEEEEDGDIEENEVKANSKPQKQIDKNQSKPQVESKKQKVNPLLSIPHASRSNKKQQSKKKTNMITENQGTKSIFTKITESIFESYINTEENHKPKAYDYLISEGYLSKIKDQDHKDSAQKFSEMLNRQYRFLENVNLKNKQRKEQQQEELKSKCTWTPNGVKKDKKEVRNPGDFYTDQLRFLEEKNNGIKKKKEDLEMKAKADHMSIPSISRNSKKIANSKHPNETDIDFFNRLNTGNVKNVKDKVLSEEPAKIPQPQPKKMSVGEINVFVTKLHGDNEKMLKNVQEERMKKIAKETKRENDLISDSTKKIFLDKLVNSYEKALLELFNRKDNFLIDYEAYSSLTNRIGLIQNNHQTSTEETPLFKKEDELLKESFNKYLNPVDERVETNYCLLFFLGIIGIYKGKNYQSEQIEEKPKEETNSKKNIEEDSKTLKKKKNPEDFLHCYLPELDLEKYQFPIPIINLIKTRYRLFYDNLSQFWAQETNEKRKEKQYKGTNVFNTTMDKTNNNEIKTVGKLSTIKDSSRKKIIDKINSEIEPNNQKVLKIQEVYGLLQKKKEKELISLRNIKEKEDMKECTFQPNAHKKKISKDISANIEKLYTDGKVTYQKKLQSEDYKKMAENRELEKCTFKPNINSMFRSMKNNPLDNDSQLKKELERREQARIERDILSIQKKKGLTYMGYSDINSGQERNSENTPFMRFDIERKTCKDTFKTFDNVNKANTFNTTQDTKRTEKQKQVPLLNIEVNIDDNNQIVKLEIFPGDDPIKIAEDFCSKHGLSNDKKEKLQRIIQEKLNEATFGENNSASQS